MSRHKLQKDYPYPANFLFDLDMGKEEVKSIVSDNEKLASVEYVMIDSLSDKRYSVLKYYWERKFTMNQIADMYGLSSNRIHMMLDDCKRILRQPENQKKDEKRFESLLS